MTVARRCCIHSAVLRGVEAIPIDVEVAVTQGMPAFNIVGMVDAAVQESRERVKAALKASGFAMPGDRVLVSLAPSSLRKSGSGFDLPIAVGILVATGQIDPSLADAMLFVGELSLDGAVRPVSGLLAYALCARDYGFELICSDDADGLVDVEGLRQRGLKSVGSLREPSFTSFEGRYLVDDERALDYRDVAGHDIAKRAFQIAAAGNHGLLMMGPPGSGKTMLASRMPSILPPLTEDEMLQAALIHSVAGENIAPILAGVRPFRAPHHSATAAGLIGGGSPIRPGEISLAHLGALFLDEISEFKPSVLQQIRQPIESGQVCITRADGSVAFPSRFLLVAASNPCACGYYGDPDRPCTCSVKQVRDYQNRIGGPLMDRIDLHLDVRRIEPSEVLSVQGGTSSAELREGVMLGRAYASWRKERDTFEPTTRGLVRSCKLSSEDADFFEKTAAVSHMSGRAIVRVLSVARTIADIAERESVGRADLCEAISFRIRDGVGR
ncbi:MAG: YifB family Mg chelatase-like AAA ATPase [Eggerthellaceae bacterium]|nr:YifB family Mg chelatase-like AAA ATPase [Eggerthellaceae bacterium]